MSSAGLTQAPPRTRIADGGHARVRWSALVIFVIGCTAGTAALMLLQPLLGPGDAAIELHHAGPALGVGLVLLLRRRGPHRIELGAAFSPRLWGLTALAVAIAATIVITAMAARDTLAFDHTAIVAPSWPLLLTAIGIALVAALGEETAWRGFLQPEFEQWCGPLTASVAVGVVWATWWIVSRHGQPSYAVAFGVTAIALSVGVRAILRFAGGHHLLVATAFHAAINVGALLVLPGRGEEALTAWALAIAALVVGGVLWAVSCFRIARTDDPLDLDAVMPLTPTTPSSPGSPAPADPLASGAPERPWDLGWDWSAPSGLTSAGERVDPAGVEPAGVSAPYAAAPVGAADDRDATAPAPGPRRSS